MKLLLKDFQATAVDELVDRLRRAMRDARRELHAISLSSPTGSGKTVMLTAAIERLKQGDDEHPADPHVSFLWITDQPELNEQTRKKMLDTSTVLNDTSLVVIGSTYDEETLKPGVVHFLNIQKLGREKDLVSRGDQRTYTIWETITNTIAQRPTKFFVIIDEAHRGMSENTRARNEAATIIQKFIKGSAGEIPPVPLVVGISATPDRFDRLISGTSRTARRHDVPAEAVRSSGLLKELVKLHHPREDQPSDMTMLHAAVQRWQLYGRNWAKYCQSQGEPPVQPILVVQVQDGNAKQLSQTNIEEALQVIFRQTGPLPPTAIAHAFQEGNRVQAGPHELRYLAPSSIAADPDVRIVFFKTSLNTGWDCPRAEVMMSFRSARDATLIAQLVGRMVRTPLARRIDTDEFLNTVSLYLPHYDEQGLKDVIARLTAPDADNMPPVAVEEGDDIVTLSRAKESDDSFAALSALPSYVIPRTKKSSNVRRLMKLARLLANDEIDEKAPEKATKALLATLNAEYTRVKKLKQFKDIVEDKAKLEVRAVNWRMGADAADEDAETLEIDIASENIEDLFDSAGRRLGEGIHKAWWRNRVEKDPACRDAAKLELFALTLDIEALKKLEATAQSTVQDWMRSHASAVKQLPESRHQAYNDIRLLAAEPELAPITYPESIETKKADKSWERHLFVAERSKYPAKFNTWETKVIQEELRNDQVVAWLRNPDRKSWSLCIPYELAGEVKPLYPDFLFVRRDRRKLVVDILDPHDIGLEDAPAKAVGLAKFAAKHGEAFGRIELIICEGEHIKRLNLIDERTRDRVKRVTTTQHLRELFD